MPADAYISDATAEKICVKPFEGLGRSVFGYIIKNHEKIFYTTDMDVVREFAQKVENTLYLKDGPKVPFSEHEGKVKESTQKKLETIFKEPSADEHTENNLNNEINVDDASVELNIAPVFKKRTHTLLERTNSDASFDQNILTKNNNVTIGKFIPI